jgi:hypothetical protein
MKRSILLITAIGLGNIASLAIAQDAPISEQIEIIAKPGGIQPAVADAAAPEKPGKTEEPEVEPSRAPAEPIDPNFIKLHLLDGNVISGELSVSEVEVDTQFGKLVIPIEKIRSFAPGLDSYPKLAEEVEQKITNLGSDDYKTREQAHKDLAAMGARVRRELDRHASDENAEIKRHVGEILKELDEQSEEQDDSEDGPAAVQPWIRLDTVVTTDFTVVGKVSPAEFKVQSKYGPLTVALADVRTGERPTGVKETLRKSLTVAGENLAQRSFKNSGIRVQAGDRISVKADGSIVMSPWGSNQSSTPDGMPNFGWYVPNQIAGGALVARIGDKGTVFKVGKQSNFTAKSSGSLQFAIGMQGEYAGEGYQFPGEYKLKVRVEPK